MKNIWLNFNIFLISLLVAGFQVSFAEGKKEDQREGKLIFLTDIRFRYEFEDNFNQKFYGDHPKEGSSDDGFFFRSFSGWF